jgi:molybdopterin molybdotransferase
VGRFARENAAVSGLLTLAQARAAVAAAVTAPLDGEDVAASDALGRVLAEDVTAAADVPPFDNSAMDGYAIHPGAAERTLRVVDEARAGRPAARGPGVGEAVRISTGAPVPAGAGAVVPLEHVRDAADGAVVLDRDVPPGANVRRAGEDLRAGQVVLARGTTLGPGELGAAVAAGRASLRCARRPRVAIVVTGDELVAPGEALAPGQIHNSNATVLATLAAAAGAEIVAARQVGDDRGATEAALGDALQAADLLVVSGGVSVGRHDHVKAALETLGVQERFWRVALKPGKPVWFGAREGTLAFGLPGNPVSAAVCFSLFARPALRALQGAQPEEPRTARLGADVKRSPDREQAVRVTLATDPKGVLVATPTGPQGSHILSSLVGAAGLALVPPGDGPLVTGSTVAVLRM